MRALILFASITAAVSVSAQSAMNPEGSAVISFSPALSPATPTLPVVSAAPVLGGATPGVTVATNVTAAEAAMMLTNLQAVIEQALPVLAAFNDDFDFVSNTVSGTTAPVPVPPGNGNGPVNLGINLGANAALNPGMSAPAPAAGTLPASSTQTNTLPPGLTTVPITRDTLRNLLVLQSDLERILPNLNALNGGSAALGVGTGFALPSSGRLTTTNQIR